MVSELREKKLRDIFDFYDVDKCGTIDKRGFEFDIEMVCKVRGFKPGEANHKYVEDTLLKIWDGIQKHGDSNNDGKVTFEEWISMWEKFAKNPSSPLEWQSDYSTFIFFVYDIKNDGVIDIDEYKTINKGFEIQEDVSVKAFKKIAKGKGNITLAAFQELYKEYFTSDDKNAPGNSIYTTYL